MHVSTIVNIRLLLPRIEVGYPRGKGREKKIPISYVPELVWLKSVVENCTARNLEDFFISQ